MAPCRWAVNTSRLRCTRRCSRPLRSPRLASTIAPPRRCRRWRAPSAGCAPLRAAGRRARRAARCHTDAAARGGRWRRRPRPPRGVCVGAGAHGGAARADVRSDQVACARPSLARCRWRRRAAANLRRLLLFAAPLWAKLAAAPASPSLLTAVADYVLAEASPEEGRLAAAAPVLLCGLVHAPNSTPLPPALLGRCAPPRAPRPPLRWRSACRCSTCPKGCCPNQPAVVSTPTLPRRPSRRW